MYSDLSYIKELENNEEFEARALPRVGFILSSLTVLLHIMGECEFSHCHWCHAVTK